MKPTVVIDIALVGAAHQHKSHARGVHRVAERILSGLIASGEYDLRFVATSSLFGAAKALAESWPGWERKLYYYSYQLILSRWAESLWSWIERTLPNRKLHMKATRWVLHHCARWADSASRRIPMSALRNAAIYHSPLYPIPRRVKNCNLIKPFLTVHDLIPLTRPETVGGKGVPLLQEQLDSLSPNAFAFCVSKSVRADLLGLKDLPSDHVFVTPLAADPEIFHVVTDQKQIPWACSKYGIPNQPYFLTLSSFDPRKNFAHVIKCFSELVEAGELGDTNLVIVGSNPERTSAVSSALAKYKGASGRIICPGFIPDEDIAAIYSGAMAFLFPSLAEGFGMPPLEAMQCGVPVICSEAEAIPEVVGNAGLLLPPTDAEAWSAALRNVWRDTGTRERMAQLGLSRSREFDWEKFTDAMVEGYRRGLAISLNFDDNNGRKKLEL